MTYAADSIDTLPRLPSWVTSGHAETLDDVAFLSGGALSHLYLVLTHPSVPKPLLRARLALRAAEACVTHIGRVERARELRDALAFLQPGDNPGPSGEVYLSWRRGVERKISIGALHRALLEVEAAQIAEWLDAPASRGTGQGGLIGRAAAVLEAVLRDRPRAISTALLLADATLSQSLGWAELVPLVTLKFKRADFKLMGDDLRLTCHRAVSAGVVETLREAADLTRRVAKLQDAAPKLRAKGSEDAVALFLSQDAVAPTMLTSLQSDRGRRRFCDRLVELGVARELTGRDTFRLYGL
ncbi:DUF1403 family protein [Yoonia sp. R2-816]|uniref:DUF1403 family protein n=1 Tax=Yoonia sp. R2-816 TaxID=3342638 RepID=UPI00372BE44A